MTTGTIRLRSRRKSVAFFIAFGASLVALAIALNVGWILLNWRQIAVLAFGVIFFTAIIIGIVLNTIFLVSEIRRNEQHDGFINAVTHELKTPIASIRLYIETLQTRDLDEARRKEFYSVMLADTDRLLRTVQQVLEAGRTGQRRRRIDRSVIDLSAIVQECVQTAETQLKRTNGTIQYSERLDDTGRPLVLGDHEELRVAVSNLVDNAVKYSPDPPRVSVEVATYDEKRLAIRVTDSGIGIPAGQLKRIFKRFYRLPARVMMQVKGSGLGLFIVRAVVERHGGRVFAESDGEGMGSTLTIVLPKAQGR